MSSEIIQDTPVCKFHKDLKKKHAVHEEDLDALNIRVEAWEIARGYSLCSLAKSEETFAFYRDLNNFELIDMKGSAEIVKTNIGEHIKEDGKLGKDIEMVSKALGELRGNLHDANNAACAMRNCLQSHLGFKDDEVPSELKDVVHIAKDLSKDGKEAADAMVKVAGIHTFSNIETLKPHGAGLTESLGTLKSSIDSFITAAETDEKTIQEELEEILTQMNSEEFASFLTAGVVCAEESTLDFICNGHCEPISCVKEICANLGNKEPIEVPPGDFSKGDKD